MMVGSLDPPLITDVIDVPNDEGGFVRIIWNKSENDMDGSSFQVTNYGLWRRNDVVERTDWDFIASMPAVGSENYDFTAPTIADTTETGEPFWSVSEFRHILQMLVYMPILNRIAVFCE